MVKAVRTIRPQLEALSPVALDLLRVLEPVLGRIIAVAVLKYAANAAGCDPAQLEREHLAALVPHLERSLSQYDRLAEVGDALRRLVGPPGGPE